MKAYVFPGQGAQYVGMGKDLYDKSSLGKKLFEEANEILGFNITRIMFAGSPEDLRQTKITQPAIFLHSVILAKILEESYQPDMTAGHSLGEFSALVAAKALSFKTGLKLVAKRAMAMQQAAEENPSTMAAIIGLEDKLVEEVCVEIDEIIVPANYNCPGQLVISGSEKGIKLASEEALKKGAKRAIKLNVGGAFHSPFMETAKVALQKAIENTKFSTPICPIYQNVSATPTKYPAQIKQNLISQLTSPVRWTETMKNMISNGAKRVIEIGPGSALQGMFKKLDRNFTVDGIESL